MLKRPIKKVQTNQPSIKEVYDLVASDLLKSLKKAKDGAKIKLGDLGTFHKKLSRVTNSFGGLPLLSN